MAHFLAKRESFSKAKFADVANFFKLGDKDFDEWPNIKLPDALLPSSVFQSFCRTTLCSFANPGSVSELANEAAMGLFLGGVSTGLTFFQSYCSPRKFRVSNL
jgi:hypothetical protein